MHVCALACEPSVCRGKRMLDPLGLELQAAVSYHLGARYQTQFSAGAVSACHHCVTSLALCFSTPSWHLQFPRGLTLTSPHPTLRCSLGSSVSTHHSFTTRDADDSGILLSLLPVNRLARSI